MKRNLITILVLLVSLLTTAQTLNIATYNIRVDKEADRKNGNGWDKRYPKICNLILFHDFHIFGAQEVEQRQLTDMLGILKGYRYIGVAREDGKGKGEYIPVFYRPDILQLLDSGNFWLSETPDIPSKGWDAECYRICTWGKFKTLEGHVFYYFNVHLDHRGIIARQKSAGLIISRIKETAGNADVILAGDFNTGETTKVYHTINNSGIVKDSYNIAAFKLDWIGTANNFDPNIMTGNRLDYIFLSPTASVKRHGVLTDTYRDITSDKIITLPNFPKEIIFRDCVVRLPSDHYPVKVEVIFSENNKY